MQIWSRSKIFISWRKTRLRNGEKFMWTFRFLVPIFSNMSDVFLLIKMESHRLPFKNCLWKCTLISMKSIAKRFQFSLKGNKFSVSGNINYQFITWLHFEYIFHMSYLIIYWYWLYFEEFYCIFSLFWGRCFKITVLMVKNYWNE